VFWRIKNLGLLAVKQTKRGTKGFGRGRIPVRLSAGTHQLSLTTTHRKQTGAVLANPRQLNQVSKPVQGQSADQAKTITKTCLSLVNARSVCNKASALRDYIVDSGSDITAITETWLNKNNEKRILAELLPEGFSLANAPRAKGRGGGVAVVYRNTYHAKSIKPKQPPSTFESLELVLSHQGKSLKLITIYRPPTSRANGLNIADFHSEFADFLAQQVDVHSSLLVIGDFNIHWDRPDHPDTKHLKDTLDAHSFTQHVLDPTHRDGHIIDLILSRSSDKVIGTVSVASQLTDHCAVECKLNLTKPPLPQKVVTSRKLKQLDNDLINQDLLRSDLTTDPASDLNNLCLQYNSVLSSILDTHAPLRTRTIRIRPQTEWMSDDILTQKRIRRCHERMWRASKLTVHYQMYCTQRDKVNSMIQKARVKHFEAKVVASGNDQKALFKLVKTLTQSEDKKPCSLSSDAFSAFFASKIQKIRDNFPQSDIPAEVCLTEASLSVFSTVSVDEVHKTVMRSPTKSCSLDPWPTWLLKQHLPNLLPAITRVINQSLTTGQVPESMKQALVTPLLKKPSLDPDVPANYRPVSNLSFLSKVVERVVAHQLGKYLDSHSLHHPYQSAYRAHHSVETALIKVHNDIMRSLDQQDGVILVMLDLSAAFDTVDHAILLSRLQHRFGVCDVVLDWIRSYLSGRKQSVVAGDATSKPAALECGVPQGSVLGPVLFSMYVSPLSDIAGESGNMTHQYADDCGLYAAFKPKNPSSVQETKASVESCVADIGKWMVNNKLKQNDDKTELLVFTPPRAQCSSLVNLTVGDVAVGASSSARNLGCTWDRAMDMEAHISNVCSACFYHLRNISAIRGSLTREAAEKVVHAFITSRLDSCNALLYHLPSRLLRKLQRVQNTAARIVTRSPKHCSITSVLQELHWLPVSARIEFKICTVTWKALNGRAPAYIVDLLTPHTTGRRLRSADQALLHVPRCRVNYGERAFSIAAPRLWNGLPAYLRKVQHFDSFKSKLKTHYFTKSYEL
jgi:exonuclease III